MNSPRDFDLPHDEWRPGQLETVKWIKNTSGTLIVQAPTGSGKCIDIDAYISTPSGITRAREMPYLHNAWTMRRPPSMSLGIGKVTEIFPEELRNCLRITTQKGYSLVASPEHKLLAFLGPFLNLLCFIKLVIHSAVNFSASKDSTLIFEAKSTILHFQARSEYRSNFEPLRTFIL